MCRYVQGSRSYRALATQRRNASPRFDFDLMSWR